MRELIIGTSALPSADVALLQAAGIGWLRHDFPFPFVDRLGGERSAAYLEARAQVAQWATQGFKLMGVTPLWGIGTMVPDTQGHYGLVWHNHAPAWMGQPGTPEFLRQYTALCSFLADDLRDLVAMWQIANELDIAQFAGPLNPRQACELVLAAARALKEGSPQTLVGTNTAGSPRAYYLYGRLYADPHAPLDYCGVDQYYGTWQPGGPLNWRERLQELWDLTGLRILINEWGYSSAGGLQDPEEQLAQPSVCQTHKWRYAWGEGHTPAVQGEFVRLAFDVFSEQREHLLGAFFYRWEDQERCWQCGEPDCPAETAWGLVDLAGRPKPAFYAFQVGVQRLREG